MFTPNRRRYRYLVQVDRRASSKATLSVFSMGKNSIKLEWSDAFKLVRTKFKIASLITVAFIASGCQTCQQHPVYCAIGSAIIVGSVVAIAEAHHHSDHRDVMPVRNISPRNSITPNFGRTGDRTQCGLDAPNRSNGIVGLCSNPGPTIPFVHPIGHE